MILELIKINEEISTECLSYISKSFKVDLNVFVALDNHAQLGYIISYLQTKNLGVMVDLNNASIFWINPFIKANYIIAKYNDTKVFTDIIEIISFPNQFENIIDSYTHSIKYVFDNILRPF